MTEATRHLMTRIRQTGLPAPETEYRFDPSRRWRFDLAWPAKHIAVEIDGAIWTGGRHVRGRGYEADCEKLNAAVEQGWRVFRYTTRMVTDDEAIEQIERVLIDRRGS